MSERKLLLADDSVTVQKVVQLTFAEEGIDVSIAGDGDSAMLNFAEFRPDIVLADVNMPGLNGYEVCEKIKQENGNIPVVLLVGSFEPFDEEEAKRVGADGSMTKPFQSIRQLVDTVSTLLSPDRAEAAGASTTSADSSDGEHHFSETIEIPASYRDADTLGDTGMDDEMIETRRIEDSSEPVLEEGTSAPEVEEEAEPAEPDPSSGYQEGTPVYNFERVMDDEAEEVDREETVPQEILVEEPAAEEPATEESALEETASEKPEDIVSHEPEPEISQPLAAPVMELDDLNFLEIPVAGIPVLPPVEETATGDIDRSGPAEPSPEFIETVVQRVVEKMSGDSLRDLIRDVVREINEERPGN